MNPQRQSLTVIMFLAIHPIGEPHMALSRRDFLNRSALAGAGVMLIGSTDMLLTAPGALGVLAEPGTPAEPGYGPLVADPAGRLALPAGFQYTIVTQAGVTTLESGEPTPGAHDGTGALWRPGGTVLVNNHEIRDPLANAEFPVPHLDRLVYDPGMAGGCTIVQTRRDGSRVREYVGIAGTSTNCAGGVTPWGTWLTCEETNAKAGSGGATKDHGYVFEVDPYDRSANRDPQPIKALGRFEHEAAAVDPRTGDIYLTEDASRPNGLLYRWEAPLDLPRGRRRMRALSATAGTFGAMKASDDIDDNEFTGPVYSLDRRILFANLQTPGTMFGITGPWRRQPNR